MTRLLSWFGLASALVLTITSDAQSSCDSEAQMRRLGTGTLGSAGRPILGSTGVPIEGRSFALEIVNGTASGTGVLYYAFDPGDFFLPAFGANVYLGSPSILEVLATDSSGVASGLAALPSVVPALCGVRVYVQATIVDAAALGGLAFTQALETQFGLRQFGAPFQPPVWDAGLNLPVEPFHTFRVADLNGDGFDDVVSDDPESPVTGSVDFYVVPADGDGGFLEYFEPYSPPVGDYDFYRPTPGDFDGDSIVDLVTPDENGGFYVFYGDGDGTFSFAFAPDYYSAGFDSGLIRLPVVADLNSDGLADVALGDGTPELKVFFAGPGRTFSPLTSINVGIDADLFEFPDVDGDGTSDLVAYDSEAAVLTVRIGVGDGTFLPGSGLTAISNAQSIACADFDADGFEDFLLGSESESSSQVFLGRSSGVPQALPPVAMVGRSQRAIGDANGDGVLDLVIASAIEPETQLWLGLGDGTFQPNPPTFQGERLRHLEFARLRANAPLDLVGLHDDRLVLVDPLRPLGTSVIGSDALVLGRVSVAVGDVNHDGWLDLVRCESGQPLLTTFAGNGSADFTLLDEDSTGLGPGIRWIELADIDEDGKLDLVFVDSSSNRLSSKLGLGDGSFGSGSVTNLSIDPTDAALGDVNGDGRPDVVTIHRGFDSAYVHLGTPAGMFQTVELLSFSSPPVDVALADADADGDDDLYVLLEGEQVAILFNDGVSGQGTMQVTDFQTFATGSRSALSLSVGDLDGDGWNDVVIASKSMGNGRLKLGLPGGNLPVAASTLDIPGCHLVHLAELTGDDFLDLVFVGGGTGLSTTVPSEPALREFGVLEGNGDGTFGPIASIRKNLSWCWSVRSADFDRDGMQDLVFGNWRRDSATLLLNATLR